MSASVTYTSESAELWAAKPDRHAVRESGLVLHATDHESAAWLLRRVLPTLDADDKVVVTAAAFLVAKKVFAALERDWWDGFRARAERSRTDRRAGPRVDIDRCEFVTESGGRVVFLPAGDAAKVRGGRPTVLLVVEPQTFTKDVYEAICQGMGSAVEPFVKEAPRVRPD